MLGLLLRLLANLAAGLQFLLLRRRGLTLLRPSGGQLLLLSLVSLLPGLGLDLWLVGQRGEFNPAALPAQSFVCLLALLAAWATCHYAGAPQRVVPAACALVALVCVQSVLWIALALALQDAWEQLGSWGLLLWWAPLAWLLPAGAVVLARVVGLRPEQRLAALMSTLGLLLLPWLATGSSARLWVAQAPAIADATPRAPSPATHESVLYAQSTLLAESLARLQPGQPGRPELFLVAVAGYGEQDVFLREALAVETLFAERFGTAGHSVVLINNPATVGERPLASLTALRRSLRAVGERMNGAEDVLFLFLTSHGARNHRFDLSLWPYRFDALTPEVLRSLLDEAGIARRVVVVSACYSGGFITPLASPDTLVMTAARADRSSHGCSHEADWTFFGRAYFAEALRETYSFERAFELALPRIAERERAESLLASEPQIAVGVRVRHALQALEQRLAPMRVHGNEGHLPNS